MKFVVPALLFVLMPLQVSADTLNDGVFTKAQVAKGKQSFDKNCQSCHPVIDSYQEKLMGWVDAPLIEFYDLVASTMPGSAPGSLTPEEYTGALAYIFYKLGYPAGDKELNPDDGSMDSITIVTK